VAFPEHETAKERAVAAGNVAPRSFAPAEDADVCEAHEGLAEGAEQGDGEDGMLRKIVAVAQAVAYEWDQPHSHVDDWVDEQDS
jgi:hypothetical protein